MKRVNELIVLGLIKETITEGAPFTKHVELTEKGKQVAKHVVEIEKMLSEGAWYEVDRRVQAHLDIIFWFQ